MLNRVINTLEPPGALLVGPCAWHGARKVTTPWSLELAESREVGSFHRSCYEQGRGGWKVIIAGGLLVCSGPGLP